MTTLLTALPPAHGFAARPEPVPVTRDADGLARQALEEFRKASYVTAIDLYRRAYELDPEPAYLYGQARAQQESGRLDEAAANFELALTTFAPGDPLIPKTRDYLQKARAALAARATSTPDPQRVTAPEVGLVHPTRSGWRTPTAWVAFGVSAAALGGAAIVYLPARDDQADLNARMAQKSTQDGKVSGIRFAEALDKQQSINDRVHLTWVLAGVGATAGAAGAWLWWTGRAPAGVTLAPGPGSVGLAITVPFPLTSTGACSR